MQNIVVELGLLSDKSLSEWTPQLKKDVMFEIHMTPEDRCLLLLVVALDELPGGTARDYADHVVKSVEHLASVHCIFNEISEEALPMKYVFKTMLMHIKFP